MKKIVNPHSRATVLWGEICRILPVWCLWPLSCFWGMTLYFFCGGRRKHIVKGYERLCKAAGIRSCPKKLARKFFRRQLLEMIAPYVFSYAPASRWEKFVRLEGIEGVREALAKGNGIILCSMHFGTNLLSLARLEQEGYKVAPVRPASMKHIQDGRVRRMLFVHNDTVYVGGESKGLASPVRDALRKLRDNYLLGIALDGDVGGELVKASLFGLEFPVRAGAVEIARLSRSPLIFVLGTIENHRYLVRCFPVQYLPEGKDESVEEITRRFFQSCIGHFEQMTREYPECVWFTRSLEHALGLTSLAVREKQSELAAASEES